jgi:phosphatidylglycerol:prolipoprotein diacylglycerol transferase
MLILFRNIFAPPRDLILVFLAAWLGFTLAEKRAKRYNIQAETLSNLIFIGMLAYLLGGRIFYAAEHLSAYIQSPLSLFALSASSIDQWGALVIAVIAGIIYGQREKLSFLPTLDSLTLFFAPLSLGLGFSHLAAGTAFGAETNLPWAIQFWGAMRHPTQIYEIAASLLTLGLLWFRKTDSKPGSEFLTFTALTAASRLIIEYFRGDSTLIFNGLREAQIVAWLVLAISLIGLELLKPASVDE